MPIPVRTRPQEYELRPKVVESLKRNLELAQSVVRAWPDTKPWIPEADREDVAKKVRACAWACGPGVGHRAVHAGATEDENSVPLCQTCQPSCPTAV